jgi:hypothetical protein
MRCLSSVFFHQTIPTWPLIHTPKLYSNFITNSPSYNRIFVDQALCGVALVFCIEFVMKILLNAAHRGIIILEYATTMRL